MNASPFPTFPDRYRIVRELGRGGMATVYLAEDTKHHRQVAIKVLRPDLSAAIGAARFVQEIELTANLQHPHILPLFDSGEAGGHLFYVMPFVEGESLRDRLKRDGTLPVAEAFAIAGDVAAALAMAHARGVVHRDIKPENILLSGGEALVADFGIALALSMHQGTRFTGTGLSLGTPAYMSPEQISGNMTVDGRSDIYALACVLYEMLTGQPPFTGTSAQSILAQALVGDPPKVRSLRADAGAEAERAIVKALAKEPKDRFETAKAFIDACAAPVADTRAQRRRPAFVALGAAVILIAVLWPVLSSRRVERARASLPAIAELVRARRFGEAYPLAAEAARRLPQDTTARFLFDRSSDLLTVTSTPAGAEVWLQVVPDSGDVPIDSIRLGRTPIVDLRLPRVDERLIVRLDGYAPLERMVSTSLGAGLAEQLSERKLNHAFVLAKVADQPAGMVAVPGGDYTIVSNDLPIGLKTTLRPFFLDKFETRNDEYRAFVRSGAYPSGFTDRTGLAGPRDWVNQEPPTGKPDHPVSGVSWMEASAYCASQGKRLPTLSEWEKSSRDGRASGLGTVMPWGVVWSMNAAGGRANFNGKGTVPVDAYPFGIGWYGAYGLAGNVNEWLVNDLGDGKAIAGGSWQDPPYLFMQLAELPATSSNALVGFRCAKDAAMGTGDQGAGRIPSDAAAPAYRPVDAAGFRALASFYRYDKREANARAVTVVETEDYRRERLWINGPGSDSVIVYLFLPKRAAPPFQTILFVPGTGAFLSRNVAESAEDLLLPHIRAGRAVMSVVMDGMIERPPPPGWTRPAPNSVEFRDKMVKNSTELRMAVDYLVTRPDIDPERLAYLGYSWGAGSRIGFAAIEDRTKAVVLLAAGIDERVQPTLPEAANFNFAPYIRQPKLMVNGRQDAEHRWVTRAEPLWKLLRAPKELALLEGEGHAPSAERRVPLINAFLDKVLGPVRPGATAPR